VVASILNVPAIPAERSTCEGFVPVVEGLIAATALERNLTAVTRNSVGIELTKVPVLNPWS
jgi:predicted nucleic acid-binding protein